jgi:hypothetical protein
MIQFQPGDVVKLTDRLANSLMKSERKRAIWRNRRGVVHSANSSDVRIIWDGRKSFDSVQIKGVEKVNSPAYPGQ